MIYLASASPQRAFLLAKAGVAYDVVKTVHDEDSIWLPHPQAMALERARHKALTVTLDLLPRPWADGDAVLAADTVTSFKGKVYGKPADRADAIRILEAIQGTTHTVTTAHCLLVPAMQGRGPVMACGVSLAQVTMRPVTRAEIEAYVDTGESHERSGAYAIQESGDRFVVDRQGPLDTIVGLHLDTVRRLYREVTGRDLPTEAGA